MTRKKTTKYALLSSVMAMVLSVAMLMGTTFAWFTDTASTAVNKIQAGALDVALEMSNDGGITWENAEGKTLEFIKAPGHENEPVLWEPGCTYKLPQLRVVNKGNLALKYKLIITGINGDAQLNEAIVWTIDGLAVDTEYSLAAGAVSSPLTIEGHMKETAGNEYQGLSIDGISIAVYAAQLTAESDSFGDQYDADAGYLHIADSADELDDIFMLAAPGDTIQLNSGVSLPTLSLPAGLNGVTFVSNGANIDKIVIAEDGIDDVTFDGFNMDTVGSQKNSPIWIDPSKSIQTITFRNTTITGTADVKERTAIASGNAGATLVLENCRFINVGRPIYDAYQGYKELIIRNCEFNNASTGRGLSWAIAVYGSGDKKVTIDNCTFIGCTEGIMKTQGTQISEFTFTNNTMINCEPHEPYGLFSLAFTVDCVKTVSGNTFDGAPFDGSPFGF